MATTYRTDSGSSFRIEEIAHHRNGCSGAGFYVVKFTEGRDRRLGIVYTRKGHVSVFDRALLADDVIAFGENSWRGDDYERGLRLAIKAWERAQREAA